MSLKKLTIQFQSMDDLFEEINQAIKSKKLLKNSQHSITFDCLDSYRSFMTSKKMNILSAISKFRPNSVYELAGLLYRKPQHVLAECRSLASHGFIKLTQEEKGRKSLKPALIFDYDILMVDDKVSQILAISKKAQNLLLKAAV